MFHIEENSENKNNMMKDKEHLMKKATINALEVPEKTEEGDMIFEEEIAKDFL